MKKASLFLVLLSLMVASCQRKGCTDTNADNYDEKAKKDDGSCIYAPTSLLLNFAHTVSGNTLAFDTLKYVSKVGHPYSIETLKYFISDITVKGEGDTKDIFIDREFYVDARDSETLTTSTIAALPEGSYSGISFRWGLSKEKNISGRYTNPPESNMEWPSLMGGGYHFMKLEGRYDSLNTGKIKFYNTHLGNPSDDYDNSFTVEFSYPFTVKGHKTAHITINMEINNWYQNPNNYDFSEGDDGIMGNQTIQEKLKQNGQQDVFTIKEITVE